MKRIEVIEALLGKQFRKMPKNQTASAYAPANIALCKYWGKRDEGLNLPITSSLSISLSHKGAQTSIALTDQPFDQISLNGNKLSLQEPFAIRLIRFLDLFRPDPKVSFSVQAKTNIPVGAGLASSACGFAALVLALDQLFQWELNRTDLSILARLGSGSASRSLWHGFVRWNVGVAQDGLDSFSEHLPYEWPNLCIGLLIVSEKQKSIGSRKAMQQTVRTSPCYKTWPHKVSTDLKMIEQAIKQQDFDLLGQTAESNALAMHATMLSSHPPILYAEPETIALMKKVWRVREEGLPVYFTQDAGPNLKLIFLAHEKENIRKVFPEVEIIEPFRFTSDFRF